MENPYQKFDEEQDRRYEKLIRQKIQNIIELAGNESDETLRISLLQKIVDLYEDLRIQVLNYTNYDEKSKQEYLKEIEKLLDKKYKALVKRQEQESRKNANDKDSEKRKQEQKRKESYEKKKDGQATEKEDLYTRLYKKALMDDEFKSWDEYRISEEEYEEKQELENCEGSQDSENRKGNQDLKNHKKNQNSEKHEGKQNSANHEEKQDSESNKKNPGFSNNKDSEGR